MDSKSTEVKKVLEELNPCLEITRLIQNIWRLKTSYTQQTIVNFLKENVPEKEVLNFLISVLTYQGSDQDFSNFFIKKLDEFRLKCSDLSKYKIAMEEIIKTFT